MNNAFDEIEISEDFLKTFLGGPGFAIDYLMKEKVFEIEPFNENNPLVLMDSI